MRQFIYALLTSFPILTACHAQPAPESATPGSIRLQGNLFMENGQVQFQPCSTSQRLVLGFNSSEAQDTFDSFVRLQGEPAFADILGSMDNSNPEQLRFNASSWYRLQIEGPGCDDPDFSSLSLRAQGNEPFWTLLLAPDGLILIQPDAHPVALPFEEELLDDGTIHISSSIPMEDFQLLSSPVQCTDSMSGTLNHMTATLDWNGHTFKGCAHYGANRHQATQQP